MSNAHARKVSALCIALGAIALWFGSLYAQAPKSPAAPPPAPKETSTSAAAQSTAAHELTEADLSAFLDGYLPPQLAQDDVAGAVICVVKDGKVLFVKGYGFSDVEKRVPVTPDNTLFRPGSISKLFTWTSVMQLVEQGKLDLNKDVNEYLDFKIPEAFGKPITLANIMTHTSGFEETARDLFVAKESQMQSLGDYLKAHIPARIFPPGVVPAYSNYATSLAGYIVQRVSGKPFDQYANENIFVPLGMTKTTFVQPLPANLAPLMSLGYRKSSGKPKPFELVVPYPAGSVSTTASDMAIFMIAHLQNGQLGDRQILKPETAIEMHAKLFASDDRMNAMAHGFYEETRNGKRIIGHGGDTELFHSDLHLILPENVGFFVSFNSAGDGKHSLRGPLFDAFLDRYFPYTPPAPQKIADAKADADRVAGFYEGSRRFENSFLSTLNPLGNLKVSRNEDNTISVDMLKLPNDQPMKLEEIEPFLYREVHGQAKVGFKKDASGRWQFQLDYPFFVFQKVGFLDGKYFNIFLLAFGLAMVCLTLILWPVGALTRRHYQRPLELTPDQKRQRLVVRIVCLLFLGLLAGWMVAISMLDDISGLNSLPPWIIVLSLLGVICIVGTIAVCVNGVRLLSTPGAWFWSKLHGVLLALGCVCLVWFLIAWKLVNFNTHF
ncbi:MAG TPA: serine hydrolase domain-containing protein [Dongiaceae bacterium]|nr:serine hydrolase domain-containing protein [Dongiaceae bacterium]